MNILKIGVILFLISFLQGGILKITNVNLADLYAGACCGKTPERAQCEALNCSSTNTTNYCYNNGCCVNQDTCCSEQLCDTYVEYIAASSVLIGEEITAYLKVQLTDKKFKYDLVWLNTVETNLTVTIKDINGTVLAGFIAFNLYEACVNCSSLASDAIDLSGTERENLYSSGQWVAEIYAPSAESSATGLLLKLLQKQNSFTKPKSTNIFKSECVSDSALPELVPMCGNCEIGIEACETTNLNRIVCICETSPPCSTPLPVTVRCVPPPSATSTLIDVCKSQPGYTTVDYTKVGIVATQSVAPLVCTQNTNQRNYVSVSCSPYCL